MGKSKTNPTKIQKLAYLKYLDKSFANYLGFNNPESEILHQYKNSFFCSQLYRANENQELQTSYCRHRWCRTCNRIKTATLMNHYVPILEKYPELYFLTLTAKTVNKKGLNQRLADMQNIWRYLANKSGTKYGTPIHGVRKLEINPTHDKKFHPHYHVITTNKEQAEYIKAEWLTRFKKLYPEQKLVSAKAQDIRPIKSTELMELFKYSTKLITKNKLEQTDKLGRTVIAESKEYDTIFNALRGKRTFQPFGEIKKLETEYTPTEKLKVPPNKNDSQWKHENTDWVSQSGETLSDYHPNKKTKQFVKQMKNKKS